MSAPSTTGSPAAFLRMIIGRPVIIKLNSGVIYKGVLACLDGPCLFFPLLASINTVVATITSNSHHPLCFPFLRNPLITPHRQHECCA